SGRTRRCRARSPRARRSRAGRGRACAAPGSPPPLLLRHELAQPAVVERVALALAGEELPQPAQLGRDAPLRLAVAGAERRLLPAGAAALGLEVRRLLRLAGHVGPEPRPLLRRDRADAERLEQRRAEERLGERAVELEQVHARARPVEAEPLAVRV